ncbi:MAG: translocation and assembly module TamB [Candidatus Eremiobacteraeota bacterium]|jgi:translocation and assembly module TamB|nr:translocation and assembly module TamB [Candidatus Eremiobacteraeota bacterium]
MPHRRRVLAIVAALVIVLVGVGVAAHDALASFGVHRAVAALGYDLRESKLTLGRDSLALVAPVVRNKTGEPVFSADRLDVRFSLRDLLPGSKARFGLHAIDLQRPTLTLIHHADGTYNVALPGQKGPPARPDTTPIDLRLRVRNGTIALIDRFIVPNRERIESLTSVRADAVLSPADPAYYRFDADLQDGARRYPIAGRARFDHARHFASQHWYAPELPIGPLVNFAIATHAVNLVDGRLRGFDARVYGFIHDDGTTDTHLGASAELVNGKLFAAQLSSAVGDMHGPLRAYDDGLDTTGIDATLANVPLHLVGGIYHLAQPQLRFLMSGRGPLARLRTLSAASARQPLNGDLGFVLQVDGPLDKPVVRGTFSSPRLAYGAYVLDDARGAIAFSGQDFAIRSASARYGPLALSASGTLVLGKHVDTDLVAAVAGPADGIPYAGSVIPHARVNGIVRLTGTDSKLAARGYVAGQGAANALDAPFQLDPDGNGTIGPLRLERSDGASLYARVALDRRANFIDGIVSAHRLSLLPAARAALPGVPGAALPPVSGTLDADVVGEVRGSQLADAAGSVHLRHAGAAGYAIGDADASLSGDGRNLAVRDLSVRGPLAQVSANGAYANGLFALQGRVRSSFERLAPLLRGTPAHGGIDAPVSILADGKNTTLQIADARFSDARIHGVPVRGASATIALRGKAIDVRAARLDAAGGHVVAGGSFGNGGTVRVSAGGIDTGALRGAGMPVAAGRLAAVATVGGTQANPRAQAGISLTGGRYNGAPLDATASGSYGAGHARIDDARVAYGGMTGTASGDVTGLTSKTPRLDVAAQVRGADAAALARQLHLPLRYPDAGIDADVRVSGAASDPALAGSARIAAGSLNGLAFHDVVVPLSGNARSVDVRGGRATVGSTTLRFDGSGSPRGVRGALRSDRADLADFNDYFDAGDTLGGHGRLALAFGFDRASLSTAGDVALADARYRRLPIGDVAARWSSRGRTIAGNATVGGPHGKLSARGSALVPARDPLAHLAASSLDADASLSALDLTTWLPALGVVAPVTGRVDGTAHVHGVAPDLAVGGSAALRDGTVGRVPVRSLTVAATAQRNGVRISSARLEALNLVATASGSAGLHANDPIALALHAVSPDIVAFANRATGRTIDASAALDTTLTVTGTRRAPALRDVLDLDAPRYATTRAKHAHLDVAFAGDRLTVADASADLSAGRLALSGSVPATLAPPFVDRRNAPVSARLLAQGIDLGQFAQLLPKDTKIGGLVDGDVQVAGTTGDPRLGGRLGLSRGSYVSPQLASRITNGTIQLALAGHEARLTTLHADVGGGALDGTGRATVGDLRNPGRSLAFRVDTQEKNIGLDVPKLIRGKIDGAVSLSRAGNEPLLVGGNLDFSHARISSSALLPSGNGKKPTSAPPPVAFDLAIAATSDDRIQGPAVDVGAKGRVVLGGTLAKPTLAGTMSSTDGKLSFYRTFVLQNATVAFDPGDGVIPTVDATATSHVPNPSTDVLLHAHGPATGLTLDFASQPNYDRAQIVGLLVGAQSFGAVNGVAKMTPSEGGGSPLQGAALGYVDSRFTQSLFEPFSSSVGEALGFSSFNVNAGLTGGFSASASRNLGKNLVANFAQTSGADGQRESFGLAYTVSDASSLQFTLFNAGTQPRTFGTSTPVAPTGPVNYQLESLAPAPGSSGYVFTYVRKFP